MIDYQRNDIVRLSVSKFEEIRGIRGIRGTGTFIHSLYTNIHNIFPQESLSKCSLS